jgi:hypothetical protein
VSGDFALAEGITFGEWVHAQFHRNVTFEREGWALERVRRIGARLQAGRSIFDQLIVEVPWIRIRTALYSAWALCLFRTGPTRVLPRRRDGRVCHRT